MLPKAKEGTAAWTTGQAKAAYDKIRAQIREKCRAEAAAFIGDPDCTFGDVYGPGRNMAQIAKSQFMNGERVGVLTQMAWLEFCSKPQDSSPYGALANPALEALEALKKSTPAHVLNPGAEPPVPGHEKEHKGGKGDPFAAPFGETSGKTMKRSEAMRNA